MIIARIMKSYLSPKEGKWIDYNDIKIGIRKPTQKKKKIY